MPWKTSDVDKHVKGLTDHQKTVWVNVANRALAACIKDGGSDVSCAPRAIRQANAVAQKAPKVARAAMASFAVELAAGGERQDGRVVRHGKLFTAGEYPDKQFVMTADELAAAVADFAPCPIDSEHRESIFDGQLGQVEAIELCEDGLSLCGAVAVPDWLDALFRDQPIPVSTTWDRETKRLIGLALSKHPRVSDAAILAAFSVDLAGRRHNQSDQAALDAAHEAIVNAGADCPGMRKESKMSRTERFFKWLSGETDDISLEAEPDVQAPPDPRIAALEAQLAEQQQATRAQRAATFADGAVRDHKALPAERAALYDAYLLAAQDDAAHGAVTFADGKQGTRVGRLEALVTSRPAHNLAAELVATGAGGVLENSPDPAKMSDERRDALLAATPLGQAALAARQNRSR